MRKNILLLFFSFIFINHLSAQELRFEYDEAGNQKVREWICLNCPHITTINPTQEAENNRLKKNFGETNSDEFASHKLMAYPNPLTEVLNVKWWNDDQVYVKNIEVFTLSGVRLFSKTYSDKERETSISFLDFAAGSYLLKASYSNNKQEVVKLIKQ